MRTEVCKYSNIEYISYASNLNTEYNYYLIG